MVQLVQWPAPHNLETVRGTASFDTSAAAIEWYQFLGEVILMDLNFQEREDYSKFPGSRRSAWQLTFLFSGNAGSVVKLEQHQDIPIVCQLYVKDL